MHSEPTLTLPGTKTLGRSPIKIKRLLTMAAIGIAACAATSVKAANILYNGDLDVTSLFSGQNNPAPDGWYIDAFRTISGAFYDGADSEPWCNVQQPGGYGLFFKPFQGSTNGGLNDYITVKFYQDNPATPNTKFTLSGYAAGEANYSGYIAGPTKTLFVVLFLDAESSILASNAYDLIAASLPSGGPGSMSLFTTPQYTAPAGTVTVRAGAFMIDAYGTIGSQSFFVDAFDLEAVAPAGSPVITNQPAQTTVPPGGTAQFNVGVSNTAGASYQWQFYGTNVLDVPGHLVGTTTASLTISNVTTADVGHYRVLVSNTSGSVYSQDATLAILGLNVDPVISISGKIGDTYRVDYATALAPNNWIPLSTNKLTTVPQLVIDTTAGGVNNRYYRAVFLH